MELDVIQNRLNTMFSSPLKEFYQRRIVFWYDEEREFEPMLDELSLPGVKLLKLTGSNSFAAKLLLSEEDTESNYLVYDPISYADIRDDWLLDLKLYSEEFRADLLSMRMDELGADNTVELRRTVKRYAKFFENYRDRTAKLKKLGLGFHSSGQLHVNIAAVLTGASKNTLPAILWAILSGELEEADNAALIQVEKFGDIEALWELIRRYTGFEHSESGDLRELAAHVLLSALYGNLHSPSFFRGLEDHLSESHTANCYDTVSEWLQSVDESKLYRLCREVEEYLSLPDRFDKLEVSDLLECELFPCVDESILNKIYADITNRVITADVIEKTIEKRRALKWAQRVSVYFDAAIQVAHMQRFYQEYAGGFSFARYEDLWNAYKNDLYRMDTYYRLFHTAFSARSRQTNLRLADGIKNAADAVEGLYKNWYLQELSSKWTDLTREDLEAEGKLAELQQQRNFYSQNIPPILSNGSRAFVIISDALRYEVACELAEALTRETKGKATISAMASVLPSITKCGMAALLPNINLTLGDDYEVSCDGLSTRGTEGRMKVLQAREKSSIAIQYQDLIGLKAAEKKELLSGKTVIYIYHNAIDTIGEAQVTEDKVFEACETAVLELKSLVQIITKELNGTNILITADHGFLYSYKPLRISDKAEKDYVSGPVLEADRRYILTTADASGEHLLRVPLNSYHCSYTLMIPQDTVRFKTGGGMNYVHGGTTLQEMMVPLITYKNLKSSSKAFVENSKAKLDLISSSRKVSNNMFSLDFYQKEPVGGKVSSGTYNLFFSDTAGKLISDVKTVIADKTNENSAERVFRVRFTLKGQAFEKTQEYYLNILEKDSSNLPERITFTIDIAFTNDFDF